MAWWEVVLILSLGMIINQYLLQDALVTFRLGNLAYLLLGFGFGVVTSLGSGLYPAWKAANEHPVEALRG